MRKTFTELQVLEAARQLVIGATPSFSMRAGEEYKRQPYNTLVGMGFADITNGGAVSTKNETLTYRANQNLLDLAARNPAKSFDDFALKHGKDISPAAVKKLTHKPRLSRADHRIYPMQDWVTVMANDVVRPEIVEAYDEPIFSSRALTDNYVKAFCTFNHLKQGAAA